MDVARVLINETCNHRCAFCNVRRDVERASVASADAIRRRIDDARARASRAIVISGGEPTLRKDLPAVIAYAARGGKQVVLETNGTRIDESGAAALKAAGLSFARVHAPAWGDAADAITGEPGGFEASRRGIDALIAAGIEVELAVPIVAANREVVAEIPAAVARERIAISGLVVVVPIEGPAATATSALLPLTEVTATVTELAEAARRAGISIRFGLDTFVPPCAFERPGRVAHLYSMTPGGAERPGYRRLPACAGCVVIDRCPGAAENMHASFAPRPIGADRMRRRLSVISSVREQIARELVTREVHRRTDGTKLPAHTVRVNFHCNQACRFCFVSTHLPPAADQVVRDAIVEVAEQHGILALSGGEPTLNPRLVEYVRLGAERGASEIELQTNATLLGAGDLAERLASAGVTDALVSLHGSCADISDQITEAPGTFVQTAAGIDALSKTSIRTRLNFVFCQANQADFPAYVEMVAQRWPKVTLTVSFVASSTDVVPRTRQLMPRYTDVMPHLSLGLARARAAGLRVSGFESMCGLPLCLVPEEIAAYYGLSELAEGAGGGEFVQTPECQRCDLGRRCFGLRRGYAELHGTSELRAVIAQKG